MAPPLPLPPPPLPPPLPPRPRLLPLRPLPPPRPLGAIVRGARSKDLRGTAARRVSLEGGKGETFHPQKNGDTDRPNNLI